MIARVNISFVPFLIFFCIATKIMSKTKIMTKISHVANLNPAIVAGEVFKVLAADVSFGISLATDAIVKIVVELFMVLVVAIVATTGTEVVIVVGIVVYFVDPPLPPQPGHPPELLIVSHLV